MNHTPTPWKVDKEMKRNGAPIITADRCWMGNSRQVAKVLYHNGSEDPEVDANARFILTACNAHEELVALLEEAVSGRVATAADWYARACVLLQSIRKGA